MAIEQFYRDLGQRVEQARRKLQLTQEQLATRLQPPLKRVTISNIETGKQRVLAHVLANLATVLEVEVGMLMPRATAARKARPKNDLQRQLAAQLASPNQAKAILKTIESTEARTK